jgi:hypothetical protein
VKELDDWYSVSTEAVSKHLNFIQKYYKGSLFNALKTLYPQHQWIRIRFSKVPNGYWQHPSTVQHYRNMFTKWRQEHNIKSVSDWYLLPPLQVEIFKRAAVGIFGSKMKMLEEWFPDIVWNAQHDSQLELQVIF